jgi:hypothetical protein
MNTFHERNLLTKPSFPIKHIQIIVAIFMAQIIFLNGYKKAYMAIMYPISNRIQIKSLFHCKQFKQTFCGRFLI